MILRQTTDLTGKPSRIISLVPSQTELLHYIGLQQETIAITKFCTRPAEWFTTKTRVGGTKNVDIKKISALSPDLIIANKEENVKEDIIELAKYFNVWVTDVNNFEDALAMINDVGKLTMTEEKTSSLIALIKAQFALLPDHPQLKNTAYLIWKDPYMTIGGDTFISNLLQLAGYKNVFTNRIRYPKITIDDLKNTACELVFLSSEPYPFSQKHVDELQQYLPGIKIVLVDGEMFSWYGSRLLKAPTYLNELSLSIKSLI